MNSGKTLNMLRILRELTQQQMAAMLGISQQAYSKMERHEWIDKKRMAEIMIILKCTEEELEAIKNVTSDKGQRRGL